ncbi:hypothetical protein CKA32_002853 [Geitlerinema sp. FC II]|nr:hypothetical protein CKA32_002853 [Geitlerinema sp. FC II]
MRFLSWVKLAKSNEYLLFGKRDRPSMKLVLKYFHHRDTEDTESFLQGDENERETLNPETRLF